MPHRRIARRLHVSPRIVLVLLAVGFIFAMYEVGNLIGSAHTEAQIAERKADQNRREQRLITAVSAHANYIACRERNAAFRQLDRKLKAASRVLNRLAHVPRLDPFYIAHPELLRQAVRLGISIKEFALLVTIPTTTTNCWNLTDVRRARSLGFDPRKPIAGLDG